MSFLYHLYFSYLHTHMHRTGSHEETTRVGRRASAGRAQTGGARGWGARRGALGVSEPPA
jgi:hypothetical protein